MKNNIDGFVDYTGSYEKKMYDVLLDGIVYPQVWPNGGSWRVGGILLCSDENRTAIKIKEAIIHPCEVKMECSLTLEAYNDILKDKEAYIERRKPIAEAEYKAWEEEREKENEKNRARFESKYISDTEWQAHRKTNITPKDKKSKIKAKRKLYKQYKLKARRNRKK